ncbi:MAG TPA: hypothetical protein VEV81_07315 [Pyrinomonadaceae bacterium]|nr:hypothetical protein [Pyrinomonadaceae bacterium]
MKAVTAKMLLSLVGILLVAPFFAVALALGARAVSLSHGAQDDLLLVALALGGAVASIINGMGRRAVKEGRRVAGHQREAANNVRSRRGHMIHLGY